MQSFRQLGEDIFGGWLGVELSGGGGAAPFSDDFERADGSLGGDWIAPTYSIVGGKAVNNPTLGPELLTDPGLEATYTGGKCDSLTLDSGTYTLAQSGDVHGGSKAQEITASSQNGTLRYNRPTITPGTWYEVSIWAKRTAGSSGGLALFTGATNAKPESTLFRILDDAAYTQKRMVLRAGSGTSLSVYLRNRNVSYDTAIVDDGSAKAITFSEMFAYPDRPAAAGWNVRASVELTDGQVGVASHVDSTSNPQSGIFAYMYRSSQYHYITCEKLVSGTWSQVLVPTIVTYTAGDILEIRYKAANTFGIYYDNVQVGTDLTISDAAIVGNNLYGMMATGGAAISGFFTEAP